MYKQYLLLLPIAYHAYKNDYFLTMLTLSIIEVELPAHHHCLTLIPVIVADGTPAVPGADLNSAPPSSSINQTNIAICTTSH